MSMVSSMASVLGWADGGEEHRLKSVPHWAQAESGTCSAHRLKSVLRAQIESGTRSAHRLKSVPLGLPYVAGQDRLGFAIFAAHSQDSAGLQPRRRCQKRFFRRGHAHLFALAETG